MFDSYANLEKFVNRHVGDPRISIAILDGPIDSSHPSLSSATIEQGVTFGPPSKRNGHAIEHGTHVTSIIVGQISDQFRGIAPRCKAIVIPIFGDKEDGSMDGASQIALAHAIQFAIEHRPHIINISGGFPWAESEPHYLLESVLNKCAELDILIVAAVGNQGCDCHSVPAKCSSVLAVGAYDEKLLPLKTSNWGKDYLHNGVLAPGSNIIGAVPGEKFEKRTGTSFACAIVSGIAALIASSQLQSEQTTDLNMHSIKDKILATALPCPYDDEDLCRRFLGGLINFDKLSETFINGEKYSMTKSEFDKVPESIIKEQPSSMTKAGNESLNRFTNAEIDVHNLTAIPSGDCSCETGQSPDTSTEASSEPPSPRYVYAIGRIGFSFPTQARQDSIQFSTSRPDLPITDPGNLARHLRGWTEVPNTGDPIEYPGRRTDARSIQWIFYVDAVPVYAIQPYGPYSEECYDELIDFLIGQHGIGFRLENGQFETAPITVERVALAGTVTSGTVTLRTGETVPVVVPEPRGTAAWSTEQLIQVVSQQIQNLDLQHIEELVFRLTEEARNLGLSPEERARNYMATNIFLGAVATTLLPDSNWEFDFLSVRKSAICRPESECFDAELGFFDPDNLNRARRVVRFTIDVSDVVPVSISEPRIFSRR